MKITKYDFYKSFMLFLLIITSLCYEIHLFKYYSIIQIIVSFLLILLMMISFKLDKGIKIKLGISSQKFIFFIIILRVFNTMMGYLLFGYNTPIDVISSLIMALTTISLFYVIPEILNKDESIENGFIKTYVIICIILSIFSILIKVGNGHFFIWNYVYVTRDASIYYDPNFCAMILGSGVSIALLQKFKNKFLKYFAIIIMLFAILFTGSRGTLLSLLSAILIYLVVYSKLSIPKKVIIISMFGIATYYGINYLYSIDFFRTYQGSNDRFEMWSKILSSSLESPVFGYGYGATDEVLKTINFTYASTHNSFLDFLLIYGIPTFVIYIIFIISTLLKSLKKDSNRKYVLPIIFMLINSNTILYSFGGVGLSSLMFTVILGLLNYSIVNMQQKKIG